MLSSRRMTGTRSEHTRKEGGSGRPLPPQMKMLALLLNHLLQPLNLFIVIQTIDSVNIPPDQVHERLQKRRQFAGVIGLNQ